MKICLKRLLLGFLFILASLPAFSYSLVLNKTANKSIVSSGDTITFCLSISPEKITAGAKADIIWVIDTSESTMPAIDAVKNNVSYFTGELTANSVDYRQGLIAFRDVYDGIPADKNVNYGFASSDSQFLSWVGSLYASGGDDPPETGLEALVDASAAGWRSGAARILILVTDAPVKCREDGNGALSLTYTAAALASQGINVYAICQNWSAYYGNPRQLPSLTGGTWLDYYGTSGEWQIFFDTITANTGSYSNVTVTDTLPPELTVVGSTCGAVVSGSQLSWNFASLLSNSDHSVCCFRARVASSFTGCINNTAYVSADGVSLTASNSVSICYPTPSVTRTSTSTRTETATATQTRTFTATGTPTSTRTATMTRTRTFTVTSTSTITPTFTITPTVTLTPIPLLLNLKGSFPNPFTENTHIVYWLSRNAEMEIKIFTISGETVCRENWIKTQAGFNDFFWDGKNSSGRQAASGVYIYRLTATTELNEKQSVTSRCACIR